MNIPIEFLLITSSIGAVQSGFFSVYLLSSRQNRGISTRLLGFLLLALAIRMAKSCGWYFSHDNLPAIIENIGYAAHLAIAPLLFLYVKSLTKENFEFKKTHLLHLYPDIFCACFFALFGRLVLARKIWRIFSFTLLFWRIFSFYLFFALQKSNSFQRKKRLGF